MPDNTQIDKALSYLRDAEPVDIHKLSPDGKKLIQDSRHVIETARLIVKQKNTDELFQNFVWHTREIDTESVKPVEVSQVDRGKLTEDSRIGAYAGHRCRTSLSEPHPLKAMRHLRTLLSLILTNSEVRKLLSDFSVIGRDLLAKGASKAAEALRPDKEEIAHVAEPASEGVFTTHGGRKVGTAKTPTLDVEIPHTDIQVEQPPRANRPVIKTDQGREATGGQVYSEAKQAVQSAQELTPGIGERATEKAQQARQETEASVEMQV